MTILEGMVWVLTATGGFIPFLHKRGKRLPRWVDFVPAGLVVVILVHLWVDGFHLYMAMAYGLGLGLFLQTVKSLRQPGAWVPQGTRRQAASALAGAILGVALLLGGVVAGPGPLVEMLRQRARPYLFSNALAPCIVEATREAIRMIRGGGELRAKLDGNAARFRREMGAAGFTLAGEGHPIIPVMLGDAVLAQRFAAQMMAHGIYVTAFSFPVVPRGQARIRTQISAAHTREDLERAVKSFVDVKRELGL